MVCGCYIENDDVMVCFVWSKNVWVALVGVLSLSVEMEKSRGDESHYEWFKSYQREVSCSEEYLQALFRTIWSKGNPFYG